MQISLQELTMTYPSLLVAGLLPTGGAIRVDGEPLLRRERALKARLGYLPQDFGLYDELTVTQFLDYMGALKGLRDSRAAIQSAIEEVHLEEKARAKIRTLSGGQRQRVGIAQALLGEPELLIFDEPTVGLDPEERIHFRNLFSGAPVHPHHRGRAVGVLPPAGAPPGEAPLRRPAGGADPGGGGPRGHL